MSSRNEKKGEVPRENGMFGFLERLVEEAGEETRLCGIVRNGQVLPFRSSFTVIKNRGHMAVTKK